MPEFPPIDYAFERIKDDDENGRGPAFGTEKDKVNCSFYLKVRMILVDFP